MVVAFLLLFAVLSLLFRGNFLPGHTLASNDGPLGTLNSDCHRLPEAFRGSWEDLNTLGFRGGGGWPNFTYLLMWVLGPVGFSKFYAPAALLILGLGAWCFFRQLRLVPIACLLGGLAATLNSGFFSAACWGVAAHAITIGMSFFALAALVDTSSRRRWLRVMLGGMAVGMGVAEGADIGAIFSIYVAVFVFYQAWIAEGPRARNLGLGAGRLALVAGCAAFVAAQLISVLVATQIQGISGTQQDTRTREERWDWATQWSLPKREALGLIVPGLFGYRMDTPKDMGAFASAFEGGNYWGAAGRDPNWYRYFASGKQGQPPAGFMRFTGGGNYGGVLVALVALWAVLQSFRKEGSVFALSTRRWIWFWFGVAVVSLLLAFGRFAPFYRLLYALPYFSTIRNPAKFTHVYNWALVVLFAYGLHGLWRHYMESSQGVVTSGLREWWRKLSGFDRRWTTGCLVALGTSAVGWLVYSTSRAEMVKYLQEVQFDEAMAEMIARFSAGQVSWFVILLAVATFLFTWVIRGKFSGPRAKWGAVVLGLFLVFDLGRANQPWIIVWDYEQKYASNPVLDRLRQNPYEQRVAILPFRPPQELSRLNDLYRIEWAQHQFLYYNIQSLDIVQMPRMPEDLAAFEDALQPRTMEDMPRLFLRRWQLTNTRYLLGAAPYLDVLNQQIDPAQRRFRIAERFEIVPKPGILQPTKLEELTAVPATNGNYALFEFTGALPRVKLYSKWQVSTNDQAALTELASTAFNPQETVIVSSPLSTAPAPGTNAPGTVQFVSYAPKNIQLKAQAATPAVLLLNDRYDSNWRVLVDGQPAPLLRCNYLMRGVFLSPGTHQVAFKFQPPMNVFWLSLAAVGCALVLCVLLVVIKDQPAAEAAKGPKTTSAG